MSQWAKGKLRERGLAASSSVPLSGLLGHNGGGNAGVGTSADGGSGSSSGTGVGAGAGAGGVGVGVGGRSSLASPPILPALQHTTSRLRQEVTAMTSDMGSRSSAADDIVSPPMGSGGTGGFSLPLSLPIRRGESQPSTRTADRTDALWAEMQATLEEVELSASEGTRVFGPDHDRKLAELRQAQIALAQAWARSEMDEEASGGGGTAGGTSTAGGGAADADLFRSTTATTTVSGAAGTRDDGSQEAAGGAAAAGTGAAGTGAAAAGTTAAGGVEASTAGTASAGARPGSGNAGTGRAEEETQVDILLARKRREANDRYFQRVSRGVLDVVAKLDDVAAAMRAVEQESKDMFGDGDEVRTEG